MKKETQLGPRLSPAAVKWLEENFSSKHSGGEIVLEAMPALYKRSLATVLPAFTDGEKKLIIDLHNAYAITPAFLGQGVLLQVKDGIDLDRMDEKWGVSREEIISKLEGLHPFDLACLEIWATGFWYGGDGPGDLEEYIKG